MQLDTRLAWTVALGMTVVPVALGVLGGIFSRRLTVLLRRTLALVLLAVAVGAPFFFATRFTPVNPFDLWWAGGLLAIPFVSRAWPRERRPAPRSARLVFWGLIALLVLVAELLIRRQSDQLRPVRPPDGQTLTMDPHYTEFGCQALFPDSASEGWFRNLSSPAEVPPRPGKRRVMHIGDSVLEACDEEIQRSDGYAALLQAESVDEEHLNLGVSNTGTDAHLMILKRWLPILRPHAVVLHSYPGNDVGEIDRPFLCSNAGPLFEYPTPGPPPHGPPDGPSDGHSEGHSDGPLDGPPTARYERARWDINLERSLELWPPPYPLRVLASVSDLARKLVWTLARLFESQHDYYAAGERSWQRYERLMADFRDSVRAAGLPLRVVVMPDPEGADTPGAMAVKPRGANGRRMLELLAKLGIEALDAAPILGGAAKAAPTEPMLLPNTPHFTRAGHRVVADWLRSSLRLWPAAPPTPR